MDRRGLFKALGLGAVGAAALRCCDVVPVAAEPAPQISEEAMQRAFDACEAEPCETCGGFGVVIATYDTGDKGSWEQYAPNYGDLTHEKIRSSSRATTWVSEPCPDCGGPKIHWTSTQERSHWEETDWGELE